MQGSNLLLEICRALVRRRGTKSDAERENAGRNSGDFVFPVVAAAKKLEHGYGAKTALKQVAHSSVVVVADRAFEHVLADEPGNGHCERKSESDTADGFPE